ncbi:type I polyketide synthase [Mycolicibacterium litorale]|uniref:Phthiocerol synthesis polyketide synthase type I PpsD n=1 Tax=Mycolicibacterium litorale TaxID=758802 RepID=A0AAD1MU22_9MYCO|nr:type I polyketide synthase [Mycolicibacterium litorale]TDY07977.1 phthiocerol/phenolphthiocerol synthesis type-I polyketide synthase D [Mycolicibacterium litorale]BBY15897.1 phthiocerol synthesis polyketide synthase type I PpsD [Mycolicibacterium litorale]
MRTTFDRISGMTGTQRAALDDQFDKASRIAMAEPMAVVGIGCRFPGGAIGPEGYWSALSSGVDAIGEVPADRWDADAFYDEDPLAPGRMPSKWGGFLPDVAGFDADFFGISPREAEAMDPQQRLLLEVAWEALEHAGVAPNSLGGTRTGVMMGVYYSEYQVGSAADPDSIDAYSATGNAHSVTVGRVAYSLGLQGPAVAVDTACSSSLVAVHLACQSLRLRESDLALAGGVNVILRPETQLALAKWGMLSPRGRCHSFDAGADGFVRGEGAGVVVLKRLTDAVRDGDRVLAVVRGSAVNQDGRSNGLTAPNSLAQRDVINRALASAEITPGSVHFVETHGTGTALGDPIEFEALAATYGRGGDPCALGAVKSNMGHLEGAAGIAGFIKAALAVQRAQIPPNLHFTQWNPAIDASPTRLFVPTEVAPWPTEAGPRRAAVSSFGLGGTNAHVVLEQGPDPAPATPREPDASVTTLVVSGKTPERVASWASTLADWMEGGGQRVPLVDVAHTLDHHRAHHARFATVCACDREQAVAGLRAVAASVPAPAVVGPHERLHPSGAVFVYSGQGSQWPGMGRQLLADEPAFAAAVDELEPIFVAQTGFSLREVLGSGDPVVGIHRIQPVLVGLQLALTALWRSYGVQPAAVIGHSMGEVTAAVVAEALSPADGLRVIATRSRLMSRLSGQGAMALLELDPDGVKAVIRHHPDVTLAVYASPRQTVIAGPPDQVDAVIKEVDAQNRLARRIEVDVASHHPTIDPVLPELRSALADLTPKPPKIPLISTTGHSAGGPPVFDADYWASNLRHPVRFSQAVAAAGADHATFIEVSPHPLLTHAITEALATVRPGGDAHVSATVTRDNHETLTFHTHLAAIQPPLDGMAQRADSRGRLADLPPTPWQHSRYWIAPRPAGGQSSAAHPLLGTHVETPSSKGHVWQALVGTDVLPWLSDHKVHGQPVMPAAAFAEIAIAAGGEALGRPATQVDVSRLEIEEMLPVGSSTGITTEVVPTAPDGVRVEIFSRTGAAWRRHAVAHVHTAEPQQAIRVERTNSPGDEVLAPADFYAALRRTGAHHGQSFAALNRIVRIAGASAMSEIVLPHEAAPHRGYRIHPVMLDAALQTLAAAMPSGSNTDTTDVTYLPVSIEGMRLFGDTGRRARCVAEIIKADDDGSGTLGRVVLTDDAGEPTAEITGIYLRRVQRRAVPLPLAQKVFDTVWTETPAPAQPTTATAPAAGSWLVLADGDTEETAEQFILRFGSPSRRVLAADHSDESAVLEAFGDTAADPDAPPAGVIAFIGSHPFDGTDRDGASDRAREMIWRISAIARAIVGGWHGRSPRLWLVTSNGLAVNGTQSGDPVAGSLRGLIRVLAYEHPDLRTTLVDLDTSETAALTQTLSAELESPPGDDVIAWRAGRRFAERLSRAGLDAGQREPVVRRDGSYIVTGGLGGVGMVVARWLVDKGAGRVVLNGRSEPSAAMQDTLAELQSRAEIAVELGDIAAPEVARRLVRSAEATGRPLKGVIHAAAVIDDQLVTGLSRQALERVWAPKATGALRLHEATADRQLDWWVGFSSVASLLGSPGQAAYACANAWLDALVAWRRASGLPATTVNWGQWSDVGVARSLTLSVLDPITPAEGVEALDAVLAADMTQVGVARLRLDRAAAAFPEISRLGYFAELVGELEALSDDEDWGGPEALRDLDAAEVDRILITRLRRRIAAIMGFPNESLVDIDQPLTELGMDSLMAVRIRNTVRGDFGVEPPVALLLQGASPRDLSVELIRQLGLADQDHNTPHHAVRDRVQQRAAARQRAATRRKVGQRL